MRRFSFLTAFTAIVPLALCLSCYPQSSKSSVTITVASDSVIHPPAPPFALDRGKDAPAPIAFRPADEMSRQDQDLVANAQSVIQEKAGFESLDFNESEWKYQQIVCPAFPNHLFLRFSRNDGTREMCLFSASIPRGVDGRLRIIPIVRKGYSLFSPAPINSLTIAAFNQIRAEEKYVKAPDWVGTGLCYGALTGGDPRADSVASAPGTPPGIPAAAPPRLELLPDGQVTIRFVALGPGSRLMAWLMSFDRQGTLRKAQHSPAPELKVDVNTQVAKEAEAIDAQSPESRRK
jgi:hypothetical protein